MRDRQELHGKCLELTAEQNCTAESGPDHQEQLEEKMSLQLRDVASRRTMTTALPLYHSSQLKIKHKNDMVRTHSKRL